MSIKDYTGLLFKEGIRECRREGLVVIEPFNQDNLNPNSYDVSLGAHYYEEQHPYTHTNIFNPYKESDVHRVWGQVQRAQKYSDLVQRGVLPPNEPGFIQEDLVIILKPHSTILAHTNEFIGGRSCDDRLGVTTKMYSRSTIGRIMSSVCKCAGQGDVGFIDRWTMEITSFSQHYNILLRVGQRVGQIEFFLGRCDPKDDYRGKYTTPGDLASVMSEWKPEQMLPAMYMDREVRGRITSTSKK